MVPHELTPRKIRLPRTNSHSMVLITGGDSLVYERFSYLMQKEFGDLVTAWYQCETKLPIDAYLIYAYLLYKGQRGKGGSDKRVFQQKMDDLKWPKSLLEKRRKQWAACERKLFQQETKELKQYARLEPVIVKNHNSKEFISSIKKLSPYFLLSLSGPLYQKQLLESIRGIAINQHAGWSPDYKGCNTIDWALYQRNLNCVGSTVHITTAAVDAGPILRRSHPCLVNSDTPESCYARVLALGTELTIEVVRDIISNKEVIVYDQPQDEGVTYLNWRLNKKILKAIYRDFSQGWLQEELLRLKSI